MYYKLLKKIEEKESLVTGSIIEIDNETDHILLDGGGKIYIQFLIREEYLEIVGEHGFKIGSKVATTNDYDSSCIYYGTIIAIHTGRRAMVSFDHDNWMKFDNLRAISDNEQKIYF